MVTRRTRFELRKAEERDHLVQGLLIALANIDEVIKIIRAAADTEDARTKLMKRFAALGDPGERHPRHAAAAPDHGSSGRSSRTSTRSSWPPSRLNALLKDPAQAPPGGQGGAARASDEVRRPATDRDPGRRGGPRHRGPDPGAGRHHHDHPGRLRQAAARGDVPPPGPRRQGRDRGANLKADDIITQVFTTTTHHWLLVFTNKGKVYRIKVHEVPEVSRPAAALYVANLPGMGFGPDEQHRRRHRPQGVRGRPVPRVRHEDAAWSRRRRCPSTTRRARGLAAINLRDGDELIGTLLTDGQDDLILVSQLGPGHPVRRGQRPARWAGRRRASSA